MKLITILILFTPILIKAQNKDDIIKQIVKINRLESAAKGIGSYIDYSMLSDSDRIRLYNIRNDYDNYLNFLVLAKIISRQELIELTKHSNGVIRMFAIRELIRQRDYEYDYYNFFLSEFRNKERIEWQYGCMISTEPTYEILLQDWSGNWNYARSTDSIKDSKFLDKILKPIDSFILVNKFNFYDGVYTDIFDRQKFDSSLNGRILELIDTNLNFWAFNYFKETNQKIFKSIEKKVITNVLNNKTILLEEHPDFFQWFLRYMVTDKQFDNAKQMIQVLKKDEYFKERLEYMLMGIDKELVDKVQ